eukprot:4877187-Prymnesium_polylepis.1
MPNHRTFGPRRPVGPTRRGKIAQGSVLNPPNLLGGLGGLGRQSRCSGVRGDTLDRATEAKMPFTAPSKLGGYRGFSRSEIPCLSEPRLTHRIGGCETLSAGARACEHGGETE